MDFPFYFQKVLLPEGGTFFLQQFFLKKPNTSEYAQVLVVTWVKLNSVTTLLFPPPLIVLHHMFNNECVFSELSTGVFLITVNLFTSSPIHWKHSSGLCLLDMFNITLHPFSRDIFKQNPANIGFKKGLVLLLKPWIAQNYNINHRGFFLKLNPTGKQN